MGLIWNYIWLGVRTRAVHMRQLLGNRLGAWLSCAAEMQSRLRVPNCDHALSHGDEEVGKTGTEDLLAQSSLRPAPERHVLCYTCS